MNEHITLVFLNAKLQPFSFPASLFKVDVSVDIRQNGPYLFCYDIKMKYQNKIYMAIHMRYCVDILDLTMQEVDRVLENIHPYIVDIIEALLKQNQKSFQLLTS